MKGILALKSNIFHANLGSWPNCKSQHVQIWVCKLKFFNGGETKTLSLKYPPYIDRSLLCLPQWHQHFASGNFCKLWRWKIWKFPRFFKTNFNYDAAIVRNVYISVPFGILRKAALLAEISCLLSSEKYCMFSSSLVVMCHYHVFFVNENSLQSISCEDIPHLQNVQISDDDPYLFSSSRMNNILNIIRLF